MRGFGGTRFLKPAIFEGAGNVAAQPAGSWQDTGIRLTDPQRSLPMCIDTSHPNIIFAYDEGVRTFAYNWRSGQQTFLNDLPVDVCSADGWLYSIGETGATSYRFRLDEPTPQPVAHVPMGAGPDGIEYSYDSNPTYFQLTTDFVSWTSDDGGVTWQSHSHHFDGGIESYSVAPADVRVVYVLVGDGTPDHFGTRNYTIYASTDAGLTWGLRSTGQTHDDFQLFRTLAPIGGPSAPADLLQLVITYGALAPAVHVASSPGSVTEVVGDPGGVEVQLSSDGGRSFEYLTTLGNGGSLQLGYINEGIIRLDRELTLSTDQGRTWDILSRSSDPSLGPTLAGTLMVAPAAPSSIFIESGNNLLLYSPDGGHSWQQFQSKADNYYITPYLITPYLPLTLLGVQPAEPGDPALLTPLPGHPTPGPSATALPFTYPQSALYALSLPDAGRSLSSAVPPQETPDSTYFPQTHHSLSGIFKQYWETHGGLSQQGYPLTEAFPQLSDTDGRVYETQYFERAVFEYHPDNPPPNNVLLSLLGDVQYNEKYPNGAPGQKANTGPAAVFFPQTNHTLGDKFLAYWQQHGGLAQQGYPISEEFQEQDPGSGKEYTVQYFERAVLEYHPENAGTPYEVLLSRLGTAALDSKYGTEP